MFKLSDLSKRPLFRTVSLYFVDLFCSTRNFIMGLWTDIEGLLSLKSTPGT